MVECRRGDKRQEAERSGRRKSYDGRQSVANTSPLWRPGTSHPPSGALRPSAMSKSVIAGTIIAIAAKP